MTNSRTLLSIAAIAVITIISGVVQGTLSGRWGLSPDLIAAGEALQSFPSEFGDWQMEKEEQVREQVREILRCTGSLHRTYANRRTGQVVNLALIVGPPGPTSVHTPEICYSSQDYTQEEERERARVASADNTRDGEFWCLTFRPNDLNSFPLSVCYAWSNGQRWEAPDNPRVSHSGAKVLYKLQLAGNIQDAAVGDNMADPCVSFLRSMLTQPNLPGTSE